MKPKFIALFTFITALTLAGINTARAADFTFTVPVQVNNLLPAVTSYSVQCLVGTRSDVAASGSASAFLIGIGTTGHSVNVDSGNVAESVTVEVNRKPGKDPSMATHYRCQLHLSSSQSGPVTPGVGVLGKVKSGTPFTTEVSGTLTQQLGGTVSGTITPQLGGTTIPPKLGGKITP